MRNIHWRPVANHLSSPEVRSFYHVSLVSFLLPYFSIFGRSRCFQKEKIMQREQGLSSVVTT